MGFSKGARVQCRYFRQAGVDSHPGWYAATITDVNPKRRSKPIQIAWDDEPRTFVWQMLEHVREHPTFESGNSVILYGFGNEAEFFNGVEGTLGTSKVDAKDMKRWEVIFKQQLKIPHYEGKTLTRWDHSDGGILECHFGSPP